MSDFDCCLATYEPTYWPRRAITGAPQEWTPLVYPLDSGGVGSHKPVSPWSAETTALVNNQHDVPTEPRRAER